MFGLIKNLNALMTFIYTFKILFTLIFLLIIGGLAYFIFAPQRPTSNDERQKLAIITINEIIEEMRKDEKDIRTVELIHFENDNTSFISTTLREKLSSSGIFEVKDYTLWEKFKNLFNIPIKGEFSYDKALEAGRKSQVQGVIIGKVDLFEAYNTTSKIKLTVQLIDVKTGEIVSNIVIDKDSSNGVLSNVHNLVSLPLELQHESRLIPWYFRFLMFVLIVLLLPIVTINFVRFLVSKNSNKVNAFGLSTYTLIDMIIAFFMIGGVFNSIGSVVLFLIALLFAFFYNVKIMSFAVKLEE